MTKHKYLIAATIITIVSFISSLGQTPTYKTYSNARFAYSISYPVDLLEPQGEAENGDGQTFRAKDGHAEMRVWGGYNINNESLKAAYEKTLNEWSAGVSYKVMRQNWFVVSALVGGRIRYRKTILKGDVFKTFEIEYDESQKGTYDSVTTRVAKSFVG